MKHAPALLALPALFLAACAGAADAPKEEWTPLPASEWRWYGHKKEDGLPKVWTIEADGSLHHAPGNGNWAKQDLVSMQGDYRDFVFEFEWKVGKAANSGIFYRIKDGEGQPWTSGWEHQILDDDGFKGGKAPPIHRAGSFYSIVPANDQKELKPVGEWNTSRIVADGDRIEHWLNGKCIVKLDLGSAEFKETFKNSEWKGNAAKGAAPNGFIGLQDHGGEVWYRNLKIRKIAPAAK